MYQFVWRHSFNNYKHPEWFDITMDAVSNNGKCLASILRSVEFFHHILRKKYVLTFVQNQRFRYFPLMREFLSCIFILLCSTFRWISHIHGIILYVWFRNVSCSLIKYQRFYFTKISLNLISIRQVLMVWLIMLFICKLNLLDEYFFIRYAPALRQLRQNALVMNFPPTEPSRLAARLYEVS